eukprot:CFRG0514T1
MSLFRTKIGDVQKQETRTEDHAADRSSSEGLMPCNTEVLDRKNFHETEETDQSHIGLLQQMLTGMSATTRRVFDMERLSFTILVPSLMAFISVLAMVSITPSGVLPVSVNSADHRKVKIGARVYIIDFMHVIDMYHLYFPPEVGVRDGAIGRMLKETEGLYMKHPVIMIPGFVTNSLELWQPHTNCTHLPRTRLWGTLQMGTNVASDPNCWIKQMRLDPDTGLDPEGIKLRAVSGFSGSTQFNELFWIWNMVISNLVAVGYDANTLHMHDYDWRMNFAGNEERDGSLSQLKMQVELFYKLNKQEKVVLVAHSMGGHLVEYFLKWVESDLGGKGGKNWVNKHIHATIGLGSSSLGMPKAVSALASGEMKDTSQLGILNKLIELTKITGRHSRVQLFQTWRSLYQMLPKGGNALWGDGLSDSPDDIGENGTCRYMMESTSSKFDDEIEQDSSAQPEKLVDSGGIMPNVTMADFFTEFLVVNFQQTSKILDEYSFGYTEEYLKANNEIPKKWYNSLETELPNAPNMTIYSLYGVGKRTERSYAYQVSDKWADLNQGEGIRFHINVTKSGGIWDYGVCKHTGDGTVPLLSLGYLSTTQWRTPTHNPYGVKIVTREIAHNPHPLYVRGGENTADHVDMLGNIKLNTDIVRIACGQQLEDQIFSQIREIGKEAHGRLQAQLAKSREN